MRLPVDGAMRVVLGALLYFPSRDVVQTPADVGLDFRDLRIETDDGERLGAWWVPGRRPVIGHMLFCHGNGGNIGDRVWNAVLLSAAGFDLLFFDYRGYGNSTGSADEEGTYRDARAARAALLGQPEVDPAHVFVLGESLGGAVALRLAIETPPRGLILQSTFTSIRSLARHHYPLIPSAMVPDAYPSLARVSALHASLLVLHGDRDDTVPIVYGQTLFDAAPEPKRLHIFRGFAHDVAVAASEYRETIAAWARELDLRC
jgi:pimeloyl-ACP methyl ester carboxylesterase